VSTRLLIALVLIPTWAVVLAMFVIMWRERTSARESLIAGISGCVLAAWAAGAAVLASRGFFLQPDQAGAIPPVGINLVVVFAGLAALLTVSASLRRLLTNQRNLIRLNLWRLVGVVFLMLMLDGRMPALWAWPAAIGDIIVGATAPWVASQLETPGGRRSAIIFNLFGLADLVVAVGLGIMTSPGPAQVFRTTPTSELITQFPLALVPTFLVPLAVVLHVISLWQLLGGRWVTTRATSSVSSR
jgi:hypothetical protein